MKPIRFGTDGWRGVIADDFTYYRVAVVCEAIGEYLRQEGTADRGVAIGYDNRFASEDFARIAAVMLTRQGIRVQMSAQNVPTPVISYTITNRGLGAGVMITASHNPAKYNGIKIKPWFGGSAPVEATKAIETRANALLENTDVEQLLERGVDEALFTCDDFVSDYLHRIYTFVDADAIRSRHPRLMVDPLYGSSTGVLDRALRELGCEVDLIHAERNPGFGGLHPEPIDENLHTLIAAVRGKHYDGAIASDGDGDRLGAVSESGQYISPHHILALLLVHLIEDRHMTGGVVKTVSTTTMINQLVDRYQLPLYETPIGFKHIGQLMMEQDILIGGEESGGIGVKGHIPERDATLAALLLVEMMAVRQTTLDGLLEILRERVGDHFYNRIDLLLQRPVTPEQFAAMRRQLPSHVNQVAITDISERDGLKLFFTDGSWLLLRASGTEPVLRMYAESDDPGKVDRLLQAGSSIVSAGEIRRAA